MLAPDALAQDECILRADCNDESQPGGKTNAEIHVPTLPHLSILGVMVRAAVKIGFSDKPLWTRRQQPC
jgi:hypothetical protein